MKDKARRREPLSIRSNRRKEGGIKAAAIIVSIRFFKGKRALYPRKETPRVSAEKGAKKENFTGKGERGAEKTCDGIRRDSI